MMAIALVRKERKKMLLLNSYTRATHLEVEQSGVEERGDVLEQLKDSQDRNDIHKDCMDQDGVKITGQYIVCGGH